MVAQINSSNDAIESLNRIVNRALRRDGSRVICVHPGEACTTVQLVQTTGDPRTTSVVTSESCSTFESMRQAIAHMEDEICVDDLPIFQLMNKSGSFSMAWALVRRSDFTYRYVNGEILERAFNPCG